MAKVLVTPRSFRQVQGPHQEVLRAAGCEVIYASQDRPLTEAEVIELISDVDGFIVGTDPVTAAVIAAAPRLKVVAKHGVGIDNIDLAAATAAGIVVTNAPGSNHIAVAELTIGLMLALIRHIPHLNAHVHKGDWSAMLGIELADKTLGLIGLGRIGRAVARRARAFEMNVIYFDVVRPSEEEEAELGVSFQPLEALLSQADIVSLHTPLTPETAGMIDAAALERMKPTAYLINTARGELVDEEALAAALRQGHLAGAALDVRRREPPGADDPLAGLDNVILTPHVGAATREASVRMGYLAAQSVVQVLRGQRPEHVLNPEVFRSASG